MAFLLATATLLLTFWISKVILDTIWSVFFGPLSTIPGPKLAAATRLLLIKHKASGYGEQWKMKLHRAYGEVVRVAPNEVSIAGEAGWKDIYGYAPGSQFAILQKDPALYGGHEIEVSLVVAEDADHIRQRKSFSPAFSEKAIRAQEPLIQGYVKQLLRNMDSTQPIDIAKQYNFATFDIMGDLAFGKPLGCLEKSEYISWISMIFGSLKVMSIVAEVNHYSFAKRLLGMMIPESLRRKAKQHAQFSVDQVEERLSRQNTKPDIWHFVLAAEEKNIRLTRGEMHTNAGLFMIAGTETTATLLGGLTFYLLTNPDKLKYLTSEIRGRFSSSESINAQEVLSLSYLTACANEAFRLHPPVPIGLARVAPRGGAQVCGHTLPEGTSIYVHQLSMGRNPNNFTQPDDFLPERWLSRDDRIKLGSSVGFGALSHDDTRFEHDKRSCIQPFSIGPRNCIGQNLAWLEIRLIMAHVLWNYDLELCEASRQWIERPVYHLWTAKPLMVTTKPVHH